MRKMREPRSPPSVEKMPPTNASGTRHIHALQWSMKANQQAKNWPEVLRLVRSLDKHKALQILVNLLRNAKNAMEESGPNEKRLTLRIRRQSESTVVGSLVLQRRSGQ